MRKNVKSPTKAATAQPGATGSIMSISADIGEVSSIREILEMAIRREEASHGFYMIAHQRSCHRVDKELFLRLAQEELLHKQNLQRQLDEVNARLFTDRALSAGEISED